MSEEVTEPSGVLGIENLFTPLLAAMLALTAGVIAYPAAAGVTAGYGRAVVALALFVVVPLAVATWVHRAL